MPTMIDVQCGCGKRFGWCGRMVDRPACPRCGARPAQSELEEIDRKMDAARERYETHPSKATLEMLRQQRVDAGLTLRQAAKLLGITPSLLSDCEWGRTELSADLAQKMGKLYDCGENP